MNVAEYYIDEDMVRDAVRRRSSFSVIHLDTMLKVDVFILKSRAFDQEELRRVQQQVLVEGSRTFYMASPEDSVLNKLEWYRMGGEVSDRQWNDILGVLKVQGTALDINYLQRWAAALDVSDLLERALVDAGLKESPLKACCASTTGFLQAPYTYLPGKNASKLFAAGFARYNTTCAANVITINAAVVRAIDELNPMGVVK